MVELFSIIGALINAGSQLLYIRNIIAKKITLVKATWVILAFIMCLQARTYFEIVRAGNPWIATTNIVVAVSFIFIAIYAFRKKRFARLTTFDVVCLIVGLITVARWKTTRDVVTAHLILQIAVVVSLVPTIVALFQGRAREQAIPWLMTVSSYVFVIAAVLLQSGFSNWAALVYPVVTGVGINGFIALLACGKIRTFGPVPRTTH